MNTATLSPTIKLGAAEYRLAPDVLFVPVADGTARVLDFNGQFFALSEVAAQMLGDVLEAGVVAAVENVTARWDVEPGQAQADVERFVAGLRQQGLLLAAGQPAQELRLRSRLAGMVFWMLVGVVCLRRGLSGRAAGLLAVAHLAVRWLGWPATVRLWQRLFPESSRHTPCAVREQRQGAETCGRRSGGVEDPRRVPINPQRAREAIDQAVRQALARSTLAHACKERGLTAWALARRAGLRPRLVIGLCLLPLHGHCWAELDGSVLGDDAEQLYKYEPVQVYL